MAKLDDPYEFHRVPEGSGKYCGVCGVPTKGLKARHRAVEPEEAARNAFAGSIWAKRVVVGFGADYDDRPVGPAADARSTRKPRRGR